LMYATHDPRRDPHEKQNLPERKDRHLSRVVYVDSAGTPYLEDISVGEHRLQADEPNEAGGTDAGPGPYEFMLAALGTCTCISVRMYAERKQWPLEAVQIALRHANVHADDCAACDTELRTIDQIEMEISLTGNLSEGQQRRLLEIARRCPVHRTLISTVQIQTRAVPGLGFEKDLVTRRH
jgi:putative redox protein